MTDKRKTKIIDMVLDWFEKNPDKFHINKDLTTNGARGICVITGYYLGLAKAESKEFNNYIMSATKHRWKYSNITYKGNLYHTYLFKPGNIKPRVNYLNKLKKSLL